MKKTALMILLAGLLAVSTHTFAQFNFQPDSAEPVNPISALGYYSYSNHKGLTLVSILYDTLWSPVRYKYEFYLNPLDTLPGQVTVPFDTCFPNHRQWADVTFVGDSTSPYIGDDPWFLFSSNDTISWLMPCDSVTVSDNLPDTLFINQQVNAIATVSGGQSPYAFSTSGLPINLIIEQATGSYSGAADTIGLFPYTLSVSDANGCPGTFVGNVVVLCNTLTITPPLVSTDTLWLGQVIDDTGSVSGGTAPYAWNVSSGFMTDLVLNGNQVTDTVETASNWNYAYYVIDQNNCSDSVTQSMVTICPNIVVNTTMPDSMEVGDEANAIVTASGGTPPYTYLAGGTFIAGVDLDSATGAATDTATTANIYSYTLNGVDKYGCSGGKNQTTVVTCPLMAMSYLNKTWYVGQNDSATFSVGGGTMPYSWSISGLPANLTPNGNKISGYTTASGNTPIVVDVTDKFGCGMTHLDTIKSICDTIFVATTLLDSLVVGNTYSAMISATNGNAPYSYSWVNSPIGLNLNGNAITDTSESNGNFITTYNVVDTFGCVGSLVQNIVALCPPVTIAGLPDDTVGTQIAITLNISGGTAPYSTNGSLMPTGWNINNNQVVGTSSQVGFFYPNLTGNDRFGCPINKLDTVDIFCNTWVTMGVSDGTVGSPYSDTIVSSDPTVTHSLYAGGPPSGTIYANGVIAGTPDSAGTYVFTDRGTNGYGCIQDFTDTIVMFCNPIIVTATLASTLYPGQVPNAEANASGGTAPYTWSWTGNTVTGLSLLTSGMTSDTVSGTGNFIYTYDVRDVYSCPGTLTDTTVVLCSNPVVTSPFSDTIAIGSPVVDTVSVLDSLSSTFTFFYQGNFIAGVSLDSATGISSDTANVEGTYNFTVLAENQWGCTGSVNATVVVTCPIISIDALSASWIIGVPNKDTLRAQSGTLPYSWTVSTLPGITRTDSILSGTPTNDGDYPMTITVTDKYNCTATSLDTVHIDSLFILLLDSVGKIGSDSAVAYLSYKDNHDSNAYVYMGLGTSGLIPFTDDTILPLGDGQIALVMKPLLAGTMYMCGGRGLDTSGPIFSSPTSRTFTTKKTGPQILSAIVQNIEPSEADIFVSVKTGGGNTTVKVYYEDDTIPNLYQMKQTSVDGMLAFHLTGLEANDTTYYYVSAVSAYGTDTNTLASFITPAYAIQVIFFKLDCDYKITASFQMSSNDPNARVWLVYDKADSIGTFAEETNPELVGVVGSSLLSQETPLLEVGSTYTVAVKTLGSDQVEQLSSTKTCVVTGMGELGPKVTVLVLSGRQIVVYVSGVKNAVPFTLYDVLGRKVTSIEVKDKAVIDAAPGVYLYEMRLGEEKVLKGKVVLSK